MKKNVVLSMIFGLVLASLFSINVFALQNIQIVLNGKGLEAETPPYIENGTTMVPLRLIMENLGSEVEWKAETKSVLINKDTVSITLQIGNKTAIKNGQKIELNVPPSIKNSRTFIPLRFVAEALGAGVDWFGDTRTVYIDLSSGNNSSVISFTDARLESAVREAIKKPTGDILSGDIKNLYSLKCDFDYLGDLNGIESLVNLTKLELNSQSDIKNIQKVLSLKNLVILRITAPDNKDEIDFSLLKNLADLTVYLDNYNDINKFKGIKNLESLGIKASNISNIESLSAFTGLKSLLINSVDLNLSFLKGLPQLEKLEVICNTIQNPDTLTSLSNLKHLTLNTYDAYGIMGGIASEGTKVDFSKILESMHNLEELYFYNAGKITSLDVLSKLPKIKKLMVSAEEINDYNGLKYLENLEELSLDSYKEVNSLKNLSILKDLKKIKSINLCYQDINDISALKNMPNLKELILKNNEITDIDPVKYLVNLETLDLANNKVESIEALKSLVGLKNLNLANNKLTEVSTLSNITDCSYVNLSDNEITDISGVSSLKNIKELDIKGNNINDASGFGAMKNLISLDIRENCLSNIDFISGMTNLKILLAGYNNISSIGRIDKLEELSRLDVTQNPITDTTVLEQLVENNEIYISCDIPMDKRLPGLTEQDKMEIIQEVLKQNIKGNLAPGTEVMLRFYDKYIVSVRDIKKDWIESLIDLNVVCMTPKEMRKVTYEVGDALKLEVICFEIQEDVVKVVLECYWVINTKAMNGGFAEFDAQKSDGKWVVEATGYANY